MNTKRAFTLVEVLTVVVIISILAALVTVAVAGAMRAGQRARIAAELSGVAMAIEQYKNEFGEYPPDFFDDAALVRHVKKRWPRFDITGVSAGEIRTAINLVYNNSAYPQSVTSEWVGGVNFNPAFGSSEANISALAIWLGGFPDQEGRFQGFSADPEAPFGRDSQTNVANKGVVAFGGSIEPVTRDRVRIETPDKKVFAELEINKNVFFFNHGMGYVSFCLGTKLGSTILPIVYFRGKADGGGDAYRYCPHNVTPPHNPCPSPQVKSYDFSVVNMQGGTNAPGNVWSDCGVVVPYLRADKRPTGGTLVWMEPTKYQLIHPGLDGKFGERNKEDLRIIDSGTEIKQWDLDNITNFSGGKELKSILP